MDYFKSPDKIGETNEIEKCINIVWSDIFNENSIFKLNEKTKITSFLKKKFFVEK